MDKQTLLSRNKKENDAKKRIAKAEKKEYTCKLFFNLLTQMKIPLPTPELVFHPTRKWRMDYAWPDKKIALEVEGGAFTRGRHTRPTGFLGDMEKYNEAALLGWRIVRVIPTELMSRNTIELIKQIINQ